MALDPYASCPCGSGKKFKWCCQPIHSYLDRAYQQDEGGQHEAALRILEEATRDHPDNPEAWGRKAEMLFRNDKVDEAETALEKAFTISPDYAHGHFLRGLFRLHEGEIAGALMLFRRASELYSPEAKDVLAIVYFNIFDCEMRLNRPVAARFAAERARNYSPTNQELRGGLDNVFGPNNPNLPECAKKEYAFLPAPAAASPERRQAWANALQKAGKLSEAAKAFTELTQTDASDAAAWHNLALTHAWNGNNPAAVDALERYVALESDDERTTQAWALAEVLLCSQGMEDRANWIEHDYILSMSNPDPFFGCLAEMERDGLLFGTRVDQENGMLTTIILEKPGPALTAELAAQQPYRMGAHLLVAGPAARFWSTHYDKVHAIAQRFQEKLGASLGPTKSTRGPVKFQDLFMDKFVFSKVTSEEEKTAAQARLRQHMEKEFEEVWLHQPLRTLGGSPPIDATGHPLLRKKLRGLLSFLDDCGKMIKLPYDFERLRRKLNLSAEPQQAAAPDIGAMSAAELAALNVESLSEPQLEEAFQAAQKLDARELGGKFASALVARPSRSDRPDRYVWFNHLVQLAQTSGDAAEAINVLDAATKDDCEHNEGRRRNDYELRRGLVHAKAGQIDQARDVFDRLIARVPDQLKVRASAAEAMLSSRQKDNARQYAEGGLAEARKQQNRDMEGHFQELVQAASR